MIVLTIDRGVTESGVGWWEYIAFPEYHIVMIEKATSGRSIITLYDGRRYNVKGKARKLRKKYDIPKRGRDAHGMGSAAIMSSASKTVKAG